METPIGPHAPIPLRRQKRRLPPPTGAVQDVLCRSEKRTAGMSPVGRPARQNFLEAVPERFYTVAEVALKLGVSEKTVRNHIRDGRLRASHAGRCVRIADVALIEYMGC